MAGAPPPAPRYAWLRPAPGVDLAHESPGFLQRLNSVGAALRRVIDVFSGARLSGQGGVAGFAGDPHDYSGGPAAAVDANIGGVPIGRVRGAQAAISAAGLRSGDQPGFYRGAPDPAHVDAGLRAPAATRGNPQLAALAKLWTDAGGPANAAQTMAAVALAESRGNASAHNNNPASGDDSWGLWQINYYGDLRASRVARFGPPEGLRNPRKNARAAVAIYSSSGPGAWSTYKSGAYRAYLGAGGAASGGGSIRVRPSVGGGGITGWLGDAAGGVEGVAEGGWKAFIGFVDGPLAIVKAALWLLNPLSWLRAVEFMVGLTLMLLGLLGLATVFASRSPTVRRAAAAASMAPGPVGAVGKGVSVVGATPVRSHVRRRPAARGSRGDRAPAETPPPGPPPRPRAKRKTSAPDFDVLEL